MYLTMLNYDFDYDWWIDKSYQLKKQAVPYTDKRYSITVNGWLMLSFDHDDATQKICNDFGITGEPRMYWLLPGAEIPMHIDNQTLCSVNFICNNKTAPVCIEGKQYCYRQALLDTTKKHGVTNNTDEERILLKFSIYDESYETLAERIPYKAS